MRRGPHKQLLALVAGGGERCATSTLAIVTLAFVATGHGWGLLIAFWHGALFASGFAVVGFALAISAQAAGVSDDDCHAPAKAPAREASRD